MHRVRWLFVAALATLGSGCALILPQVKPATVDPSDPVVRSCTDFTGAQLANGKSGGAGSGSVDTNNLATRESVERAMNFPGGIDPVKVSTHVCSGVRLAEGYYKAYQSAVDWNTGYRNVTAAVSIALGALLVREGLQATPSNNKIADFGVALAALYGLSTQLTSKPREKVYLNGMKAMSCAILEVQPLVIGAGQLQGLKLRVDDIESARMELIQALSGAGLGGLTSPADAKYLNALANAQNAVSHTGEFAGELAKASGEFAPLVQTIATEVSSNIVDTEASEQSLSELLSGFGAKARGFVQSAQPPKAGPGVSQSGTDVRARAENQVAPALAKLVSKTQELNSALERVVIVATVTSKVKACSKGPENLFEVDPNKSAVVVEVGKSTDFNVTNRNGMPTAHLEGEKADAVELGDMLAKNGVFVVRITGKTATGDAGPVLVIKDGAGLQEKRIAVSVSAATKTAGVGGSNAAAANGPAGAAAGNAAAANAAAANAAAANATASITKDETEHLLNAALAPEGATDAENIKASVTVLQCVIDAKVDGTVGKDTREAIKKFRKSQPADKAEGIDDALIGEVRTALGGEKKSCKAPS